MTKFKSVEKIPKEVTKVDRINREEKQNYSV